MAFCLRLCSKLHFYGSDESTESIFSVISQPDSTILHMIKANPVYNKMSISWDYNVYLSIFLKIKCYEWSINFVLHKQMFNAKLFLENLLKVKAHILVRQFLEQFGFEQVQLHRSDVRQSCAAHPTPRVHEGGAQRKAINSAERIELFIEDQTFMPQSRQSAKLFSSRRRVCATTLWFRGGAYSLAGEGLGESQSRRGDIHYGTLYI
jgi:hypothetical protein